LCLVPGILFFTTYFEPDIRLQASRWLVDRIPPQSRVLSEGGNVVNLPVYPYSYEVNNFDFYQLDTNPALEPQLYQYLNQAQYILVPSRRIFKNQNNSRYPISNNYYHSLFSGRLGFSLVKTFFLRNYFILNPENAEETFSVFDQPTIRVYQKNVNP
jgi:hypothetical protein